VYRNKSILINEIDFEAPRKNLEPQRAQRAQRKAKMKEEKKINNEKE